MTITTESISVQTGPEMNIVDITDRTSKHIRKSGINNGIISLFVPGSTGALTTV
jgi:thiamine phosphate synthase YjbQ (UPF0047 family)